MRIINSLFKYHKQETLLVFVLLAFYFASRLYNLTIIPIFTDEAIYLRWSQIGSFDPKERFIPLTDGKPPLFHWIVMISIRFFSDPLVAGRIVSVFAGSLNLIGISLLAYQLTRNKTIALLSSLLYLTSPFFFVYDRLAVVDNLLTTFSIFSLYFALKLQQQPALIWALSLGTSVGLGLLTKSSALLYILMTPATLLLDSTFPPSLKSIDLRQLIRRYFKWAVLLFVAALLCQLIYNSLRLSDLFFRIEQKNYEFIIPFSEFIKHPFAMTWGNIKSLVRWQIGYLTLPVALTVFVALIYPHRYRPKLLLLLYYLAPLIAISSFNKIIFPRFLIFSAPFLLILSAMGLFHLFQITKSLSLKHLITALCLSLATYTSILLLVNPLSAPIPQADRDQLLDSWPAGWGINETVAYLAQQANQEPIHIGTQGTFGLLPHGIEIYLDRHPNTSISSYWPVDTLPDEINSIASKQTTFFIYNELEDIPPQDNLELIMEFQKRRGDEIRHMRLFRVYPLSQKDS